MVIQAGKSITPCPRLVSIPLTGLERMLSSSLNMVHHLSYSDYCSCGGIGMALHYATECILTVSWHVRKPVPNVEQEWLKRVANNFISRHKISRIVKFISENNRDLFRSSFQLSSEVNQHAPNYRTFPLQKRRVKQHLKRRLLRTNSVKVKMPVL
ncbi:hypothetical protein AVEN_34979-1 [Araneus ventricosus]|uniref:Uncharacterized protein n=1 Tax=Araneus ventricosus TaxID=182803 RepID=A0A4Y2DEM8_ARAVE|nr:hypothetical protein AVEN_34979-1 [Araneus ventricosus]